MAIHNDIAAKHGERVLAAIQMAGEDGLTDFEIADQLEMYLSSVNATRNALMRKGRVRKSGSRRPSGRGGTATVWLAA